MTSGRDPQGDSTWDGPASLDAALSPERLLTYRNWAEGDAARAVDLYALNTALSEALYTPMQMLEVAMRNRFHAVLAAAHGPAWFDGPGVLMVAHQMEQVRKARHQLAKAGKRPVPGRIVAELPFGFWTAMLGTRYEALWRRSLRFALHAAARDEAGRGLSRGRLATIATQLRTLRNRVAHHEPILYWDLPRHHDALLAFTGWLSPGAAAWSRHHGRFPLVLPAGFTPLPRPAPDDGTGEA